MLIGFVFLVPKNNIKTFNLKLQTNTNEVVSSSLLVTKKFRDEISEII